MKNLDVYNKILKNLINWEFKSFGNLAILNCYCVNFFELKNCDAKKLYKNWGFQLLKSFKVCEIKKYIVNRINEFKNIKKIENYYKNFSKNEIQNYIKYYKKLNQQIQEITIINKD